MEMKEMISKLKEYNKTLPLGMSDFENALYKNGEDANYYINFSHITGAQYVEDNPENFLKNIIDFLNF